MELDFVCILFSEIGAHARTERSRFESSEVCHGMVSHGFAWHRRHTIFCITFLELTSMSAADWKCQDWTSVTQTRRMCLSGQQRVTRDREINFAVNAKSMGSVYMIYMRSI